MEQIRTNNIKGLRLRKRLRQADLAAKCGVTSAYISALETDVKTNPSFDVMRSLAKALDCDIGDLYTDTSLEPQQNTA